MRLYFSPISRLLKSEKFDFAIVTSGCDHVVLKSDAEDLRAAAQGELGLYLSPLLRFVEPENLDLAIETSGYDHVVFVNHA